MSDLIKALRKAVELPPPHEHTSHIVYAGHSAENARLKPLLEKLIAVVEAAESYHAHSSGNGFHSVMQQKLADLRAAVGMGEK